MKLKEQLLRIGEKSRQQQSTDWNAGVSIRARSNSGNFGAEGLSFLTKKQEARIGGKPLVLRRVFILGCFSLLCVYFSA
jgi:hypothetical protein